MKNYITYRLQYLVKQTCYIYWLKIVFLGFIYLQVYFGQYITVSGVANSYFVLEGNLHVFSKCQTLFVCFFLQSDIWAMGVCVYEMTTLKRPFNAHRMQQLVFEIVHGQVRSIDVKLVDGAII